MENFLSLKLVEFYWGGINKIPDKWHELIQNEAEYTIDWNYIFVKLFIYKSHFTKTEIINGATQFTNTHVIHRQTVSFYENYSVWLDT